MISIIVATKNRQSQLVDCLQSIYANRFKDFEVIVIEQSRVPSNGNMFRYPHLTHLQQHQHGKSRALNLGITLARGDILAFTDDDCVVDHDWIRSILDFFTHHPDIDGVFGKILPYQQRSHKNEICPCVCARNKSAVITKPCLHYEYIGFGNNKAFRKKVFEKIGNFKPWLGPGSIGSNCEDGEIAQRALIHGHSIGYNPNMIVYHNKWLTAEKMRIQQLSYVCGEMACYGYFSFQHYDFAKPVVKKNITDTYWKIRKILKQILVGGVNGELVNTIKYTCLEAIFILCGLVVGLFYSIVDPIR